MAGFEAISARYRLSIAYFGFKVGDEVTWNSEVGHVSGTIIKVHTADFDYKGYTHHAIEEEPQYEIKSSKTNYIAANIGKTLKKKP